MTTNLLQLRWIGPLGVALCLTACGSSSVPPSKDRAPVAKTPNHLAFDGGSIDINTAGGNCRITLHGDIQNATVRRMGGAFDAIESTACQKKTLVLDTANGWVGDAITLGAMARNRGYDTEVKAGSVCYTPCLLVFAAGQSRLLPDYPQAARIGFSQLPPDQDFGQQQCKTDLTGGQYTTLKRYLNAMLPAPTATAVMQKLVGATCDRTDVYGPAQALALGLATATR